nr:UDP-N-acetylmuramoyl-tripeptide--D-alanyl-D-alanine ligase [Shimazuella soli]
MKGKLLSGKPNLPIHEINFARFRSLKSHQIYICTKHSKWEKQLAAIQKVRPVAVVIPNHLSAKGIPASVAIIRVKDPYAAYWKMALWNWKQFHPKVIGITGSAGKSTTTAMVASILRQHFRMVHTEGNLNTFSFLPNYLIRLNDQHNLLLLEIGMKSLNNIRRQCNIVKPHIGVVTNVGEAHAGSLGGLNRVVKAKQELVEGVRSGGVLYINADDERSKRLDLKRSKAKIRTFGLGDNAYIRGENIKYTGKGIHFDVIVQSKKANIFIPTYGKHNVYNALAAIGIATSMGISLSNIQRGLARFRTPKMRLQVLSTKTGRTLINDAWNANPTAMKAGLNVLKQIAYKRPKIAVLGDMLELGSISDKSHASIGQYAAKLNIDQLITVGRLGRKIALSAIRNGMNSNKVFSYYRHAPLIAHIKNKVPSNAVVYFKASRKLHLEKVVQSLR